jgi:FAD/FMN-containing dehydrogenase
MMEEERIAAIVGKKNVSSDAASLEIYARDMSFVDAIKPRYVVQPQSSQAIQKLVQYANETRTPLVPVSSGAPHFRGDTVPSVGGAVIVDLSAMKKVIKINEYLRVAMVEAGVTFEELIPEVEKAGIRLNMPLLPRKTKTVVGSMLEREPVLMPKYQWDSSDPVACFEVVFGNGDVFRTGQAAGPGTIEQQWAAGGYQKTPYGPGPAQWHRIIQGAQGTMGIVTWASLRCELLPKLEEPFMVGSGDLNRLFDLAHWLIRMRLVNECLVLNNTDLASIMAKKWPADYERLKAALPPWVLFYIVAGYDYLPEERINASVKGIADISRRIGVESSKAIGGVSAGELLKIIKRPSSDPYWKLRYKGACQDIFFITTYAKIESQIKCMSEAAEKCHYPAADIGIYVQPVVQGTSCHCEFNLFYDDKNKMESGKVRDLTMLATKSLIASGAFFSRPYGETASMIVNRDAASVAALNKVKGIIDPNRIMNPGKLGF